MWGAPKGARSVPDQELLFHLTDAAEPPPGEAPPRSGDRVELRPGRGGMDVEAWSMAGRRLGRLPPAERSLLDGLLTGCGWPLQGQIEAILPRPSTTGAGRIHIRIQQG
jgi:hypothetical protein